MRNRALLTLAILAVAALLLAGAADAQRLVKSEPANGARGVDPSIGVIRLHFDCDMLTDSFTVVDAKEGPFPPVAGDNSRPWKSPRLFVLSIGKLEAGKTYALQLNSPTRTGFQSASRKPLPVTVVTFTAGGGGGPGPKTDRSPIVGTWDGQSKIINEVFEFTPNGQYRRTLSKSGVNSVSTGSWRIEAGTLVMKPDGETVVMRHPVRFEGAGRMVMVRSLGEKAFQCPFTRRAGGGGDKGGDGPQGLAGLWQTKDKGMTYLIRADGNYSLEIREGGQSSRFAGRWRIEGEILVFTDAAKNHAQRRFKWKREATHTLRIHFPDGGSFLVHRVGRIGKEPPHDKGGLVGTWVAKDATGSAKVVFTANGRYTREFNFGGDSGRSAGTWKIQGKNIIVHDEEEGESLTIPFSLPDPNTLRMTVEGDTIQLRRQGAKVNRPAQLVGQWEARDKSGSMVMVLGATGRHRMTMRNPQQNVDFQGEWRVEGQTLVLTNEANGRELRMAFQPAQGGLQVDIQGTKIQMKKVR